MKQPKKDGGQAFPGFGPWYVDGKLIAQEPGMPLRDWFAGQVLMGETANPVWDNRPNALKLIARHCYAQADEMIAAREGGPSDASD